MMCAACLLGYVQGSEEALGHTQRGWVVVSRGLFCSMPQFPHL